MRLLATAGKNSAAETEQTVGVGRFTWDVPVGGWWWSDDLFRIYGYEPGAIEPSLDAFMRHKHPQDLARIDAVFNRCLSEGGPFSCWHRIVDAGGKQKTVVVVGFGERSEDDERTVRMHGFMVDVTLSGQQDTNAALEAALQNRAGIDQVKGAIMLVHGIDADAAFALLRGHSQAYNKKVAAIVADLLVAFQERADSETITRAELDQILWTAAHS
jgi:hypothetical protein